MKVDKIKRTLSKFTSVHPDEFILKTEQGRDIDLGMKGHDFNLGPGMVLYMHKIDAADSLGASSPIPSHFTSTATSVAPSPPVGRLTPPPPHAEERVRDVSPLAPLPPDLNQEVRREERSSFSSFMTSGQRQEEVNTKSGTPLLAFSMPQRHVAPTPPQSVASSSVPPPLSRQTEPQRAQSPSWQQHAPSVTPQTQARAEPLVYTHQGRNATPQGRNATPRSVSPVRPLARMDIHGTPIEDKGRSGGGRADPLWDSANLSQEQNRLQEKLLGEFEAMSKEERVRVGGHSTPTHQGSPAVGVPPKHSSTAPSPTAALESRIKTLRAENAKLRLNASTTSVVSDTPTTSPAPLRYNAASPSVSAARSRAMTPPPPPQAVVPAKEAEDVKALVITCSDLARTRHELEIELDEMKQAWTGERRLRMTDWEDEHRAWSERQQDLIRSWEADKHILLEPGSVEPVLLLDIHEKWERLKQNPTDTPRHNTSLVEGKWAMEKTRLIEEITQLTRQREEDNVRKVNEKRAFLEALRRKKREKDAEVARLKQSLSQSRHDTEENKQRVVAASHNIATLRQKLIAAHPSTTPDESKQIVNSITEKAMLTLRVTSLRSQHSHLAESLTRETARRKHLHNTLEDIKGGIRAIVRMRPVLPHDLQHESEITDLHPRSSVAVTSGNSIVVSSPTTGSKEYAFYRVFDPEVGQEGVFSEVRPLVQSTIDGFNACVMAYGQTGSGKTYTIMGDPKRRASRGVLPRAVEELFAFVKKLNCEFRIKCSMIELYLDTLNDLLTPDQKKCELRQLPTGLQITCTDKEVSGLEETLQLLKDGTAQRQVHSTLINPKSSRSHAVFTLALTMRMNGSETTSKLSFVDLAGSERVKVSHSKGERLKEAQMINKSLSALGDVVSCLSQKGSSRNFVPYRNSKLTMILQEALGGNSKTVLFACVCPAESGVSNISETISTLVFASRVKHVYNPYLRNITRVQNLAIVDANERLEEDVEVP